MKTVVLAGGKGTRLAEETEIKPKPMLEIGGKPMLWHIMNIYSHFGINDFLIAAGYKSEIIKEYFTNFYAHQSDITVDLENGACKTINSKSPNWKVSIIDTGLDTLTGGRLLRLKDFIGKETFMLTYGDGVANINISDVLDFHRKNNRYATITAVRPPARFGSLSLSGDKVEKFSEKSQADEGWINGGFFVFEPDVFDYLEDDQTILERDPLEELARDNQLVAYRHDDFWQPMDTLRDKRLLESLWNEDKAPWKTW